MLDALDESPLNERRKYILDALKAMRHWGVQSLHLFVTSHNKSDIREPLDLSSAQEVSVHNGEMNRDINDFVSSRLDKNRRLLKLSPHREKIQESLAVRANGMFRWVECLLEALRSCPPSEYYLDLMLNSLPESLDETYERMLCNINYHLTEDARRILTLLCFARRPLTVQELIDGIAVEINGDSSGLNHKRRLQDPNGIRDICGVFIDIYVAENYTIEAEEEEGGGGGEFTEIVRIAHFSVQEYLESERIRHQKAAKFRLISGRAHSEIAQICLTYLCERGLSQPELNLSIVKDHPLAFYAAEFWDYHRENATSLASSLHQFILKLFRCRDSFVTWVGLHDPDPFKIHDLEYFSTTRIIRSLHHTPTPIYYLSLLGLDRTLRTLTSISQDESEVSRQVNSQGGYFGDALQAASSYGHDHVVQILLDKGTNINAQGGYYGNALQAASDKGHDHVIKILLENGADINAQGDEYESALQAVSHEGHDKIVKMLLEKGANVNAQGGRYGNALQAASYKGHIQIVQLLLNKGADINAHGGFFNNALKAAFCNGLDEVVQLLLDRGAVLDAKSLKNLLSVAKARKHDRVVQLLQDHAATS